MKDLVENLVKDLFEDLMKDDEYFNFFQQKDLISTVPVYG